MTRTDKEALKRAIKVARAESPEHAGQIDRWMAQGRSFEEIGRSCAYGCQCRNLRLKPWQSPPMYGDVQPGHEAHADAEVLLRKLLAAGLSRYEPDPLAALEAAATEPAA
jgi:hypothetical protein